MQNKYHESVLLKEVVDNMPKGKVIDCTLGTAGHYLALTNAGCEVLGIEMDPKMIKLSQKRIPDGNFVLGNFSNLEKIAIDNNFTNVDGILLDLGVSNIHLRQDSRGFSFFEANQELDMRLNPEKQGVKAMDLLNALNVKALEDLFMKVMTKDLSRMWAKAIINHRPIKNVGDIKRIAFNMPHKQGIDSATLPMLSLRIAVNSEYENLKEVLPTGLGLLKRGGKLLVITFHSGEEKIVTECLGKANKIILPSEGEVRVNPRSRSAKLYIYEKN